MTARRILFLVLWAAQVLPGVAVAWIDVTCIGGESAESVFVVYPARVQLSTSRDRQAVVVQVRHPDGSTRDVSSNATFAIADRTIATMSGGEILPVGDGKTELIVQYEG